MFNPTRDQARAFMIEAWRKRRARLPATPMELMVSDLIGAHPEYHGLFEAGEGALQRDWTPEGGETNPFLHISLHVSVREQVQLDQPPGMRAAHAALTHALGDPLVADHQVMDCLAEQIWQHQRNGLPLDNARYLACVHAKTR